MKRIHRCRRIWKHTTPAHFGPQEVAWESGTGNGSAFVDGVCYSGEKRPFKLAEIGDVCLSFGLELLANETAYAQTGIELDGGAKETFVATWPVADGLMMEVPLRAHR